MSGCALAPIAPVRRDVLIRLPGGPPAKLIIIYGAEPAHCMLMIMFRRARKPPVRPPAGQLAWRAERRRFGSRLEGAAARTVDADEILMNFFIIVHLEQQATTATIAAT